MIAQGEHANQSRISMLPMAHVGCGWRSRLANLDRSQVSHEEKQEGIGWDVQVEVDKTVNQNSGASHQAGELQRPGKRVIDIAQPLYGLPKQDTQKPGTTERSEQTRFGEGLEIVVVGMVDDFSVVK